MNEWLNISSGKRWIFVGTKGLSGNKNWAQPIDWFISITLNDFIIEIF